MIRIALPGLLMVEAEVVAFEILTVAASYISTSHLAAQTVLSLLSATTFQIPFALHVASSARVGSLVGANLVETAQMSIRLIFAAGTFLGCLNLIFLSSARNVIPCLFTSDPEVIQLVASVLPLCAAFQLFDALATNCSGILQAIGRQNIGGWVNLFCYYVVSLVWSFVEAISFTTMQNAEPI